MKTLNTTEKRVGVIGLGNVLMGDDAFGPYMIELLASRYEFPTSVTLLDLGTPSLDLTAYLEDLDALVVIDAVHARGARAGELRTFTRAEILKNPIRPRISPHEPGLKEALLISEFDGRGPTEALLVGVVPESISAGTGMSDAVLAALPRATDAVLAELSRLGVCAREREPAREPRIWWEQVSVQPC